MTDLQIVEAAEEVARAADRAVTKSLREFPMFSADMMMRLCVIARRGLTKRRTEERTK